MEVAKALQALAVTKKVFEQLKEIKKTSWEFTASAMPKARE